MVFGRAIAGRLEVGPLKLAIRRPVSLGWLEVQLKPIPIDLCSILRWFEIGFANLEPGVRVSVLDLGRIMTDCPDVLLCCSVVH
jgi:hypothetical protein